MSGDFSDPVHIPGFLGAVSAVVLGWLKFKERNEVSDLRTQHDARLAEHERKFDTLQTKDDSIAGRKELREDITRIADQVNSNINALRSDIMALVTQRRA